MRPERPVPDEIASVRVDHSGAVVVVRVAGEIDGTTEAVVAEPLFACLSAAPPALVVDLTEVRFIGSVGLNLLVRAHLRARRDCVDLRVVAEHRPVLRLLEASGLVGHLPLSRSLSDALARIGATGNVDAS